MLRKPIVVIVIIFVICVFWLLSFLPTKEPIPSPEDLESMDVYQMLSSSIHEDMTPEELVRIFAQMCEMPVECRSDMILVEYDNCTESEYFNIHLVRQFEFSDKTEFVQLHLDLYFPVNAMTNIPKNCTWYDTGTVDIQKVLMESESFQAVKNLHPEEVTVFTNWSW